MALESNLYIKKYKQEGDINHEYNPLFNIIDEDNIIKDFRTTEISVDLNNPVNIECQPSYDGTVNLILNDDINPPRIINTRFTVTENLRYKTINRNQLEQTNLYRVGKIDSQTRLFRNINKIPQLDLRQIGYYGQLKGGNYTFYVKYADNDYNKTDIVCESGMINIFKGTYNKATTISGTLLDEVTDKSIMLTLSNIDTSFSKLYLYYIRESSDILGTRITNSYMLTNPYDIQQSSMNISINGFEEVDVVDIEELNIKYNLVTAVKTQVQVQNMLFFGNIQGITLNLKDLQNISLFIKVKLKQSDISIGYLDPSTYDILNTNDDIDQTEYYNPLNTYYKLGYWPGEIYRLGIVYIMVDDSLSPVFNLRGGRLDWQINESSYNFDDDTTIYPNLFDGNGDMVYVPQNEFITSDKYLSNTKGVFKNPDNAEIFVNQSDGDKEILPLYYNIEISDTIQKELKKYGVKGYFIVRQKRIPITLCQGLSIGIDGASYTPTLYEDLNETNGQFISEGFINRYGILTSDYESRKLKIPSKKYSALLSLDPCVNSTLQSMFDSSEFVLQRYMKNNGLKSINNRQYYFTNTESVNTSIAQVSNKLGVIFVGSDIPIKYINGYGYSTRAGNAEEVKQFSFFGNKDYNKTNRQLIRGIFCPILGVQGTLQDSYIYNIKIQNYSSKFEKEYFSIRGNDNSSFYAISQRYELDTTDNNITQLTVFRGDCFTNTVTMRLQRNFLDPDVPFNELIVDPNTWVNNYNGYSGTSAEQWTNINRADINSVPIGTWVTFKCLSNYNLGLRSIDTTNTEEFALLGNPRSFVPFNSISTSPAQKTEESWLLNDGYNATVGHKRNLTSPNVPYIKDLFDNRIMFSNVQIDDDFRNAYRIFQGLSYQDIDRQYGAIVKLLQWGVHLLCVFEHGIAIIPINEKALIQTDSGQSVHMYGAGVIQNQVSLISPDFGSTWQDSIIRTPVGIYGVDTYAKKIWRVSQDKGLELLSDVHIQRFLNDNILLKEEDKYPTIALKNVKTHFNNYKGDVMFTFYNDLEDNEWHMCYNERLDKWITRYSWIPLFSENINNIFYSLDKKRAEILAYIYDNQNTEVGIRVENNQWSKINNIYSDFQTKLNIVGYDFYDDFNYKIVDISSSYIDQQGSEVFVNLDPLSIIIDENNYYLNKSLVPTNFNDLYDSYIDSNGTRLYNILTYTENTDYFIINKSNLPNDLYYSVTNEETSELFYHKIGHSLLYEFVMTIPKELLNYTNGRVTYKLYYFKIKTSITPKLASGVLGSTWTQHVGIVLDINDLSGTEKNEYDNLLLNGFYVHGRAGIFDEINYFDSNENNQILPTKWYDKQEPFEFEFIVNNLTGLHKIFNDLVIISNKVEPKSIDFEIIGDVYDFNKAGIYKEKNFEPKIGGYEWDPNINSILPYDGAISSFQISQDFKENVNLNWDPILNQYTLISTQDCKNINNHNYGRRLGNIQYKEDSWYIVIEPIKFRKKYKDYNSGIITKDSSDNEYNNSTRIRDKFLKVRIKYSGTQLAIITALKTMMTLSYA